MTLALTVVYKCTSDFGENKSSGTMNIGGRATLYHTCTRTRESHFMSRLTYHYMNAQAKINYKMESKLGQKGVPS